MTYAPAKFEVATSNGFYKKIHYLALRSRSHEMLPEYPLHHLTYAPAKFEVATSNVNWCPVIVSIRQQVNPNVSLAVIGLLV